MQLIRPVEHRRMWGYATIAGFALMQAVSGYFMAGSYTRRGSYHSLFATGSGALLPGVLMIIASRRTTAGPAAT